MRDQMVDEVRELLRTSVLVIREHMFYTPPPEFVAFQQSLFDGIHDFLGIQLAGQWWVLAYYMVDEAPFVPFETVGADDFRTFQIPIVEGRSFQSQDAKGAPWAVIVSQSFARATWPGKDPIGMRLRNAFDTTGRFATVIGVARDTHYRDLRTATSVVYFDWEQMNPF